MTDEAVPAGTPEAQPAAVTSDAPVDETSSQPIPTDVPFYDAFGNEDLKAFAENRNWKSPESVVQSYKDLEKLARGAKDVVSIPDAEADESAWGDFYNKLGRPENKDSYQFIAPEGTELDEDAMGWAKDLFFANGLTPKQAQGVLNSYLERETRTASDTQTTLETSLNEQMLELKKTWGSAYDQNSNIAKMGAKKFGLNESEVDNMEKALGYKRVMELAYAMGNSTSEHGIPEGGITADSFVPTPAQAGQSISDLKMDSKFMDAYLDNMHAGHQAAVSKMQSLIKLQHPQ